MPAGAVSVSVSGTGARLAAPVETDTLRRDACAANEARGRADSFVGSVRRAHLRGVVRGTRGGAGAGRLACARTDDRSLRHRRAPDLRVRDAHRLDARARRRGVAAPDVLGARDPHPAWDVPLRTAVD